MSIRQKRSIVEEFGFTLIELLGVAVIIIILSLTAFQVFDSVSERARTARSRDELRTIEVALERYRTDLGHYPNHLMALVQAGYLKKGITFESAWSKTLLPLAPSKTGNATYIFYAVDTRAEGQALAYALGDSGRRCRSGEQLHADSSLPLPCGRPPALPAYSFHTEPDLVLVSSTPLEFINGHASLSRFRTSCQTAPHSSSPDCDLKSES